MLDFGIQSIGSSANDILPIINATLISDQSDYKVVYISCVSVVTIDTRLLGRRTRSLLIIYVANLLSPPCAQ